MIVVVVVVVVEFVSPVAGWPLIPPPIFTTPGTLISPVGMADFILTVYRT